MIMFAGENDVEVAESLTPWIQNKQRTKQQSNREGTGDIRRYVIEVQYSYNYALQNNF